MFLGVASCVFTLLPPLQHSSQHMHFLQRFTDLQQHTLVDRSSGFGLDESSVVFTRAVLFYDRNIETRFDDERAERAVREDAWRSDPVVAPEY